MVMAFGPCRAASFRVGHGVLARGDEVWVLGPGLNSEGAEGRAQSILGPGWRSAVVKGQFLRKNRRGVFSSGSQPARPCGSRRSL